LGIITTPLICLGIITVLIFGDYYVAFWGLLLSSISGIIQATPILFWLFREINGDKVATILVFKSADNLQGNIVGRDSGILPTIALIMCADF
jgi:hypothetical protein